MKLVDYLLSEDRNELDPECMVKWVEEHNDSWIRCYENVFYIMGNETKYADVLDMEVSKIHKKVGRGGHIMQINVGF